MMDRSGRARPEDKAAALASYGRALQDYHFHGRTDATLLLESSLGEREALPVAVFFRGEDALLPWEAHALDLCRGWVLDAGAGAGVHALILQERGHRVTAIDLVPEAVAVMRDRGVADARVADLFGLEGGPFDTALLMMNGFGPAGDLDGLDRLLHRLRALVAPDGQVLADGAGLRSPPEARGPPPEARGPAAEAGGPAAEARGPAAPPSTAYPGETQVRLAYGDGPPAPPFRELYVDFETLSERARAADWVPQLAWRDEAGGYLVRLVRG